jgi:hypothetical protein
MPFALRDLERYLALYGADVNLWPESVKNIVFSDLREKDIQHFNAIAQYRALEKTLNARQFVCASDGLVEKICANAFARKA